MKKYKYLQLSLIAVTLLFSSCNDFLDELPDNRTVADNQEKIGKLLVSSYPYSHYSIVTELSSDNVVDTGSDNPYTSRFYNDVATWEDGRERTNDDLTEVWQSCYYAISNANQALKAIEEMNLDTDNIKAFKGEALVARAYSHFVLVNVFSKHYNTQTSATDLGITYMYQPETTLKPSYTRGTVKEVYESIEKDLEEGLSLVSDNVYSVPKYHFNKKASYAFAARFYLYYQKWQKAIDYANLALGASPKNILRNWEAIAGLTQNAKIVSNNFIKADNPANLLLQTNSSKAGLIYGPYYECARYTHTDRLAQLETVKAKGPWGASGLNTFWLKPFTYATNNLNKTVLSKLPYIFQYTDIVAQTGYVRTINVLFSTDETLLTRAEALIMLKKYDEAVTDLNLWSNNYLRVEKDFSKTELETFYQELEYSTETKSTQKKKLNPKFDLESGTQENLIHCVLQYRRILTLHEGLRWFDIKRYGIEVNRYKVEGSLVTTVAKLEAHDNRKALQLPKAVIKSGLTPNPR